MISYIAAQVGASPGEVYIVIVYIKLLFGLGITVIGLQGYRRNRSRPMLFLAFGIAGLTFLSSLAALVAQGLVIDPVQGAGLLITEAVELLGVLCIAYSLYLLKRG